MAGQGFASLNISGSSGRGFFKVSNLVRVAELLVLRQNTKLCFPSSLTSVASAFMEPRARIQSTHTHTHTNTCIHNTYIYICMYMYMYMYVEHAHVYMSLHTYIYIDVTPIPQTPTYVRVWQESFFANKKNFNCSEKALNCPGHLKYEPGYRPRGEFDNPEPGQKA